MAKNLDTCSFFGLVSGRFSKYLLWMALVSGLSLTGFRFELNASESWRPEEGDTVTLHVAQTGIYRCLENHPVLKIEPLPDQPIRLTLAHLRDGMQPSGQVAPQYQQVNNIRDPSLLNRLITVLS